MVYLHVTKIVVQFLLILLLKISVGENLSQIKKFRCNHELWFINSFNKKPKKKTCFDATKMLWIFKKLSTKFSAILFQIKIKINYCKNCKTLETIHVDNFKSVSKIGWNQLNYKFKAIIYWIWNNSETESLLITSVHN